MKREDLEHWNNKKYWVNYQTTIKKILDRMYSKETEIELIIPEYQRDYVWKESNAPKLLLSLYKGYPIGNIVLWDGKGDNGHSYSLIDGLQRHMTILKLYEKEFNYVPFLVYKHWLKNKGMDFISYTDKLFSEQEAFRHFKSSMHHKNKNYKASNLNDAINFIENTNAEVFKNDEIRQRMMDFVKDFDTWHKDVFPKINIPHYILDNMNSEEVAEVFELINITGVKLNKFEIASANWSMHRIEIDDEIDYIKEFNEKRIKKYKSNFENEDEVGKHLIKYDNKKIIPSNFLYAIFYEIFKDDNELKNTFIDSKNDYTIITKAIEPLCEVALHILKKDFGCEKIDFDMLGQYLSEKIKKTSDVKKLKDGIKNAFVKVKNKISIIKMARLNGEVKFPAYPVWLLATFAIHIINGVETNNFNDWFVKELLFDKRLSSATGNKAREIIKNLEFEQELNHQNSWEELIETDDFQNKKYSDRDKAVVLSMIQKDNRTGSIDDEIDHFIPRSKVEGIVDNVDNIWNLQYLSSTENNGKDNKISDNHWKYDAFSGYYSDEEKNEMENACIELKRELKIASDENIYEINEIYNKIINLRKEVIKRHSSIFN